MSNPPPPPPAENPMPQVTSVSPASVLAGAADTPLTIAGSGFISTSTAQWNGTAIATVFQSATSLSATIPASDLVKGTTAQITVQNPAPGGGKSTGIAFAVDNPVPTIASVSPASVTAGAGNTTLDIKGTNFVPSAVVTWNGAALAASFVSNGELTAVLPAADLTTNSQNSVAVQNPAPGGGLSTGIAFAVDDPVPTIASVSPASVTAGAGTTTLDVKGTNFVSNSVVIWNGGPLTTSFMSSSELTAVLPAANLTGSSQNTVAVQNPMPGGGTSTGTSFNVNSPVAAITSISPRVVPPGVAATITINGTGFESNSVALWNTSPRPTTFINSTNLQVALSAADLQNQGTDALTVSNPGPGASTSAAAQLTVTSTPLPVIQSVAVTTQPTAPGGPCQPLLLTIGGQNFAFNATIQVNGVTLSNILVNGPPTTLVNFLPLGFTSQSGALTVTVTNPGGVAVTSDPFPYPSTSPAVLALCASPSPTTVFAGSSFSMTVQPSGVNLGGNVSMTLGTLPSGISAQSSQVSLPLTGTTLHLQAASSTVAGTYDLTLKGASGAASGTGDFDFTVSTSTPPAFLFAAPLRTEVGVPIGGSGSIQYQTIVNAGQTTVDYDVTPSVSGLPPGTGASFTPSVFAAGQSVTVTLTAANNAPVTQNGSVTLIGTPSDAAVANATSNFFVDVTQPPGSLPGNRTDYVSTAGTPFAAVYDATHNLIFSSNPSWNRVDVISNSTHKIVKSISVRSPRWIDITQDNGTVWVQTASSNIWGINTGTLRAKQYTLPRGSINSSGLPVQFSNDRLLALADGTLLLYFDDSGDGGGGQAGVWNPQTNQLSVLAAGVNTGFGIPVRSGDGTLVYTPSSNGMQVYATSTKSLRTIGSVTAPVAAVSHDGSKLVVGSNNLTLYDKNLTVLGTVPGTLPGFGVDNLLNGGVVFSGDGTKLYEIGVFNSVTGILTLDANTLQVLGEAPATFTSPVGVSGAAGTPTPFAVDATAMILGIQNYGISFDDSSFFQHYVANQPNASGDLIYDSTLAGPLAGGTTSSVFTFPGLIPDVWFGQTRGSVNSGVGEQLMFTSPPGTMPGPVNLKFIFPDGEQLFGPQAFSYSTFPTYAVTSGSSPAGAAPAQVIGYGLPADASGGTLAVGGNTATITSTVGQNPPFGPEPFPSAVLKYTFPSGQPGWADLQITTPIGTGTLPKSIFYAQSVTDYSSPDTFTAVLYDPKRDQVYLSAGDHIDVFSLASGQFTMPLAPAAIGAKKQFAGLALTPDGNQLLAADLLDSSLALINPDSPSTTFAIPIAPPSPPINSCAIGPLYVGRAANNLAFVTAGSEPAPSCPQYGDVYLVNLQTHGVSIPPQCTSGFSAEATADGSFVAIGGVEIGGTPCLYNVQTSSFATAAFPASGNDFGISVSADGNVIGSSQIFADIALNLLGAQALPTPFYGNSLSPSPLASLLPRPRLTASGSSYFLAYPTYFEVVDVPTAALRMRFALTETVQDTASPIAIDSGGRRVFLITDKGLTVVDFGAALLSIGHLSQSNVAPGTQVTVRGSGFDSTVTATVGGVSGVVSVADENTLTLTIPAAASGPEDIVLSRGDGTTYTLANGVVLP